MPNEPDDRHWGKFASSGLELAAGIGLGVVVGMWIDRRWHCDPWGLLIGTLLGFTSGMYLLIKDAMKSNKD
jgi:F0F1-type ATP synthase assembly protein I